MKRYVYMAEATDGAGGGTAVVDDPAVGSSAATNATSAKTGITIETDTKNVVKDNKVTDTDKGFWPDDWRTRLAGEDEKALKQLGRYASPDEVWKKARSLEQRLSSGELKPILTKDAGEDEVKEYRKAHGIPEAPDKYDIKDVKIDDVDKPFINEVLKVAHGAHLNPSQAKAIVSIWPQIKAQVAQADAEADATRKRENEDALRLEWGADFRKHQNVVSGFLDRFGQSQEFKAALLESRLPDGTKFGDSAEMKKFLLNLALIENPAATVVPAGGSHLAGVEDELAQLKKFMTEHRADWNKDSKKQSRYMELLNARDKLAARK